MEGKFMPETAPDADSQIRIGDVVFRDIGGFDSEKLEKTRHASGTLVVSENDLAQDVAAKADAVDAIIVLVVDTDDHVSGILLPDEMKVGLRSELGFRRPGLYWCEMGQHYSRKPCPEHP